MLSLFNSVQMQLARGFLEEPGRRSCVMRSVEERLAGMESVFPTKLVRSTALVNTNPSRHGGG
jgi:hypothetical protein